MTTTDKMLHRHDRPGTGGEVTANEIRQNALRDQMEPLITDAPVDQSMIDRAIISIAISLKRLADEHDHSIPYTGLGNLDDSDPERDI